MNEKWYKSSDRYFWRVIIQLISPMVETTQSRKRTKTTSISPSKTNRQTAKKTTEKKTEASKAKSTTKTPQVSKVSLPYQTETIFDETDKIFESSIANSSKSFNLICAQFTLYSCLDYVKAALVKNPTHTLLNHVLFKAEARNKIQLVTNNLQLSMKVLLDAQISQNFQSFTIPLDTFQKLIKKFPQGEINLTIKENQLTDLESEESEYRSCQISLSTTKNKTLFELNGLVEPDFPQLTIVSNKLITIPSYILIQAISKSIIAASNSDDKKILNGVKFCLKKDEDSNKLIMSTYATDSYKACLTTSIMAEAVSRFETTEFIIDSKILKELSNYIKDSERVDIYLDNQIVKFSCYNFELLATTLQGEYPSLAPIYSRVESENNKKIIFDRVTLLNSIERLAILASDENKTLIIELNSSENQAILSVNNKFFGKGTEVLEVRLEIEKFSPDSNLISSYLFAVNIVYLTQIVKALDSQRICLSLSEPHLPFLVKNERIENESIEPRYILMGLKTHS
jgi:DNA polymerase-3 subunit beta